MHRLTNIGAALLAAALLVLPVAGTARAVEYQGDRLQLNARELRDLEWVMGICRVRLAEREKSAAGAVAHLAEAEKSAEWFRREAASSVEERRGDGVHARYLALAAHLAYGYGRAAALAFRSDPETARELMGRRAEWLGRSMPADASAPKLLALAELRLELGEAAGAAEVCRLLLARHDPDGDGRSPKSELLPSFAELGAALADGGSFTELGEVLAARAELAAIERLVAPRPAAARGEKDEERPAGPDLAAAAVLAGKFLAAHPRWDVDRQGQPGRLRKGLLALAAELEFRDVLLRARALLLVASGRLTREALEAGEAERAGRCARGALAEAGAAVEYRPNDARLRLGHAWCLLGAGQARKSAEEFAELRRGVIELGDAWWEATAGLWRALLASGERGAADRLIARLRIESPKELARRIPQAAAAAGDGRAGDKAEAPRP
jgi:hypothetical protein